MEDGAEDGVLEIEIDGKTRRYRPPWRIYPDLTSRDWKMLFQLRECYVDERFPFAERDAAGGFTQHAGKAHYPDVVQWAISNISADVDVDFVDTLMKEILAKLEAYDLVMAVDEFLVLGPDVLPEYEEDNAEQSDSEGEEDFFDAGEFFVSSLDDNDAEAKEDERRFARNPFEKMLADQAAPPTSALSTIPSHEDLGLSEATQPRAPGILGLGPGNGRKAKPVHVQQKIRIQHQRILRCRCRRLRPSPLDTRCFSRIGRTCCRGLCALPLLVPFAATTDALVAANVPSSIALSVANVA